MKVTGLHIHFLRQSLGKNHTYPIVLFFFCIKTAWCLLKETQLEHSPERHRAGNAVRRQPLGLSSSRVLCLMLPFSQIAAMYILPECKVLICDYSYVFVFFFYFDMYIYCIFAMYDDDT